MPYASILRSTLNSLQLRSLRLFLFLCHPLRVAFFLFCKLYLMRCFAAPAVCTLQMNLLAVSTCLHCMCTFVAELCANGFIRRKKVHYGHTKSPNHF